LNVPYGVKATVGKESTARAYINIELPLKNSKLEIKFDRRSSFAASVTINDSQLSELLSGREIHFSPDSLFSDPFFLKRVKENKATKLVGIGRTQPFLALVEKELSGKVDGRTGDKRISHEARRILRVNALTENTLQMLSNAETLTFKRIYNRMLNGDEPELREALDSLCQSKYLLELLETVGYDLAEFFKAVEYIGPARARSERFYRQQELEVSDISPDGKNLPMFLASLEDRQLRSFSDWVKRVFGYGVSVHKTEGHISINLEHRGQSVNVVDTGYGVSQVLPVLAQIWWMQFKESSAGFSPARNQLNVKTLTIEQPELHLHPAHQALLADVFVEALSTKSSSPDSTLHFLVETHSEALINRLGELIENGAVSADDIQVVIFGDVSDDLTSSDVTISEFDKTGILNNWPYGFFNFS